jgi:hypothetical protein
MSFVMTNGHRLGLLSLLVAACTGCMQQYRPPTAKEPHAVVKLRRVYEKTAGTDLREQVVINDYRALAKTGLPGSAPSNDAMLVRPEATRWVFSAEFYHQEMKRVEEHYTEQQSYTDQESYSCGSGSMPRTCYRSVTRYRPVQKSRWVHKNVDVTDGSCKRELNQLPRDGKTYLVQFTYQDHGVCRLSCIEQGSDGAANQPCEVPPPHKE